MIWYTATLKRQQVYKLLIMSNAKPLKPDQALRAQQAVVIIQTTALCSA
jgi:hypothetical protein